MLLTHALTATTAGVALVACVFVDSPAIASAPSCQLTADLPTRIAITHYSTYVPIRIKSTPSGCTAVARYDVARDDGSVADSSLLNAGSSTTWTLSAADGPGSYTASLAWLPLGGERVVGTETNTMAARFGSELRSWSAQRNRGNVTLSTRAFEYSADGWVPAAAREVALQTRTATGWSTVRVLSTEGSGVVRATVASPRTATWRAVLRRSAAAWGATGRAHSG